MNIFRYFAVLTILITAAACQVDNETRVPATAISTRVPVAPTDTPVPTEAAAETEAPEYILQRQRMVEQQIAPRDIHDEAVLGAMRSVPRHKFVPEDMREFSLCRPPAADRLRPDHLPAFYRGFNDPIPGTVSRPKSTRNRYRFGLPGCSSR